MKRRSFISALLPAAGVIAPAVAKAEKRPVPRHFFANWKTREGQWREATYGKVLVDGVEIAEVFYIDSYAGIVKTYDYRVTKSVIRELYPVAGLITKTLRGRVLVLDRDGAPLNDPCDPAPLERESRDSTTREEGIDVRDIPQKEQDDPWYAAARRRQTCVIYKRDWRLDGPSSALFGELIGG